MTSRRIWAEEKPSPIRHFVWGFPDIGVSARIRGFSLELSVRETWSKGNLKVSKSRLLQSLSRHVWTENLEDLSSGLSSLKLDSGASPSVTKPRRRTREPPSCSSVGPGN